jgi:hypothetical protein
MPINEQYLATRPPQAFFNLFAKILAPANTEYVPCEHLALSFVNVFPETAGSGAKSLLW